MIQGLGFRVYQEGTPPPSVFPGSPTTQLR